MKLSAFRVSKGVDLDGLNSLFNDKTWADCLPTALPEAVLLSLAHDFRRAEISSMSTSALSIEDTSALAAAIYTVTSVVSRHPDLKSPEGELDTTDEAILRAMKFYQIGLEREIVSRITGLVSSYPKEQLAADLLDCLA